MKKYALIYIFILCFQLFSFAQNNKFLILVENERGFGYVNTSGDIIIPYGKYNMCFTDTIKNFGIVMDEKLGFIGINNKDKFLFKIMTYDNGPDYISDGLFRILENGKIGYANSEGKIVISPQFECAYPFEDGYANVSYKCETGSDGEYESWGAGDWFLIDKKGKKKN